MTRTVDSGGVKLAVQERGDVAAPTVILVHGFPDNSGVWDEVADRLESRYHVVTYDVRGAGKSDRPRGRSAYTLDLLAADLHAVADAVSPDQPVHVVAHDWGSIQCWEAITDDDAESRFASYTTCSGPSLDHVGHWSRSSRSLRGLPRLLKQAVKSWYIVALHLPFVPTLLRVTMPRNFDKTISKLEGLPVSDTYPNETIGLDAARGVLLYRANIVPRMIHPRERRTRVPVQLIVAVKDRYVSPSLAESCRPFVDRLWVREVQTGHWLPRKAPDAMAQAVSELVDHIEGGDEPRDLRRLRAGSELRDSREFADKLVVVTGAGSGIGRETALAFGRLGAEVVIADRNGDPGEETAGMVRDLGVDASAYVVDVADVTAMEDFVKRVIADHGVPDVVVNNAGIGIAGAFLDTTAEDWERIVDINLLGVVHGCRLFGTAMADRHEGGHIVNVASAAAFMPSRTLGAYCTTKSAVLMLSECLRAELDGKGIGVSAICPGIVNTPITTSTHYVGISAEDEAAKAKRVAKQYQRRNYPPSKVATAIVKAVRTNKAVVPVTPEAAGARFMSRLSPGTMRRMAKVDAL